MRSSRGSLGRTATVLVHSTVLDVRSNVVCHFSNLVPSTRVRGDLVINYTQTSDQEGVEWSKGALCVIYVRVKRRLSSLMAWREGA